MSAVSLSLHPVTRSPRSLPLRLTRRGRLLAVLALTVALFTLVSLGRVVADAGLQHRHAAVTRTWVVQPGQSLWTIASAVAPGTDPRDTVARIVELNHLPGAGVTVGQALQVPA